MKTVTAAQANRRFSSLLQEVASGKRILITPRGRPVATIEPARAGMSAAKHHLLEHLRTVRPTGKRDWTRDELYG